MLERRSLEGSSPGEGIAGSLSESDMATCERRLSDGMRPSLGEPPRARLPEDLLDRSARLREAAAARDVLEGRGEGESCRSGEEMAVDIDRACGGEEAMLRDGGKELRSGGAIGSADEMIYEEQRYI
jgi:hypothetical protein